jgi:osmotically-inducible protein OsmY
MLPHPQVDRTADLELEKQVHGCLARESRPSLGRVQVTATRGIITLRGRVVSFYERQLAIQCCRTIAGVKRLIDALEVA